MLSKRMSKLDVSVKLKSCILTLPAPAAVPSAEAEAAGTSAATMARAAMRRAVRNMVIS